MPVLPPTDESTCASSVVGTWMNGTPRMKHAAAKPAMSPTTPPPSDTTVVRRSAFIPSRASKMAFTESQVLCDSPSGSSTTATGSNPWRKVATRRAA